jgi:hypothetical protein
VSAYERVTYRPEGARRARSVLLENVNAGRLVLTGRQVDRDGSPSEPSQAYLREHGAVSGEVLHVIDLTLVTKREPMTMDLHYGWLVPAGTESDVRA